MTSDFFSCKIQTSKTVRLNFFSSLSDYKKHSTLKYN